MAKSSSVVAGMSETTRRAGACKPDGVARVVDQRGCCPSGGAGPLAAESQAE